MEFKLKERDYVHYAAIIVTEAVATCGLMLAFNLQGHLNPFILFAMCLLAYRTTQAHLNPALSIGVYVQ